MMLRLISLVFSCLLFAFGLHGFGGVIGETLREGGALLFVVFECVHSCGNHVVAKMCAFSVLIDTGLVLRERLNLKDSVPV